MVLSSITDTVPKTPRKTSFQNAKTGQASPFLGSMKNPENMPRVLFNEESKTGLGSEIGHRQQKCWLTPNV